MEPYGVKIFFGGFCNHGVKTMDFIVGECCVWINVLLNKTVDFFLGRDVEINREKLGQAVTFVRNDKSNGTAPSWEVYQDVVGLGFGLILSPWLYMELAA